MPPMLVLGSSPATALTVDPPLFLAPMAGVTDRDFRLIVRRIGGIGMVSMEFISSKLLLSGDRRTRRLMDFSPEERPLAVQIYGSDPASLAAAAKIVDGLGVDLCDINMGCPANKVLAGCAGAALMGDPLLAARIVRSVRAVTTLPLTVKFRLGLDEKRRNYLEIGRVCQEEGADGVTLHARTARQMYTGEADWRHIGELKAALRIPVIGNGDVREVGDALRLLAETGCDGLMIGRGATRNPWIFRQIAAGLGRAADGAERHEPTVAERKALVLGHFRTVVEREEPEEALHKLRSFTKWYSQGMARGAEVRRQIGGLTMPAQFFELVERAFEAEAATTAPAGELAAALVAA
jgi:tRNA-dihydrouridine synthase B